jgi:hypothetical protein
MGKYKLEIINSYHENLQKSGADLIAIVHHKNLARMESAQTLARYPILVIKPIKSVKLKIIKRFAFKVGYEIITWIVFSILCF